MECRYDQLDLFEVSLGEERNCVPVPELEAAQLFRLLTSESPTNHSNYKQGTKEEDLLGLPLEGGRT